MSKIKWTSKNFNSPEILADIVSPEQLLYFAIVSLGIYIFYCILMEWRFGWTIGKRLMQLRVLSDGGASPKIRGIVLRNLTKAIELPIASPHVIIVGIMAMFPILTRYNQRLGDMMGRTSVVNAKTVGKFTPNAGASDISSPPLPDQDASSEEDEDKQQ